MKRLLASAALIGLMASAASAEINAQTAARAQAMLNENGFQNVVFDSLTEEQKIQLTTIETTDQSDAQIHDAIASVLNVLDNSGGPVSAQTDAKVASVLERYNVTDVDVTKLDDGQKVAITLIESDDISAESAAAEIQKIAEGPVNTVPMVVAEKARAVLDEYGYQTVNVTDLTREQVLKVAALDLVEDNAQTNVKSQLDVIVNN